MIMTDQQDFENAVCIENQQYERALDIEQRDHDRTQESKRHKFDVRQNEQNIRETALAMAIPLCENLTWPKRQEMLIAWATLFETFIKG